MKRMSVPKIAVLATGLTAAVLVGTMSPQAAQAYPSKNANCSNCHGGSTSTLTTGVPSTTTPAAGATYTVAITLENNPGSGNSGYAIVPAVAGTGTTNGGDAAADTSYTATMTAPTAPGAYTYTVYTNMGSKALGKTGSATYTITVASVVPPTTVPPVAGASIRSLSPSHGRVGTTVTIRGTGFEKAGVVNFGAGKAKVTSWSSTTIVVKVPSTYIVKVESDSSSQPVWYRHDDSSLMVTVTPKGGAASIGVGFRVDSQKNDDHGDDGHQKSRH